MKEGLGSHASTLRMAGSDRSHIGRGHRGQWGWCAQSNARQLQQASSLRPHTLVA
jgi:hypothetical protein